MHPAPLNNIGVHLFPQLFHYADDAPPVGVWKLQSFYFEMGENSFMKVRM